MQQILIYSSKNLFAIGLFISYAVKAANTSTGSSPKNNPELSTKNTKKPSLVRSKSFPENLPRSASKILFDGSPATSERSFSAQRKAFEQHNSGKITAIFPRSGWNYRSVFSSFIFCVISVEFLQKSISKFDLIFTIKMHFKCWEKYITLVL